MRHAGVTEEQIAEAKRWDLLSYLQAYEPGELKKSGPREYRTRSHDSLVISNGKWHWCSRNMGGRTALDYLIKVRGQDFVSAVETLCGGGASPFLSQPVDVPPPKPFEPPEPGRYATRVMGYLQGRGIDGGIISRCLRDGSLYESFRYHNCVFVGRDMEGKARFACLRGTFGDFKMDVPGSDKRFNFCLASPFPDCQKVAVFESAIDALSGATLTKLAGKAWEDACYLSLGGTSPLALVQFLKDRPGIRHVALCLDNDGAGKSGTEKLMETLLSDRELSGRIETLREAAPPERHGKDYNQHLLGVIGEMRARRKEKSFER